MQEPGSPERGAAIGPVVLFGSGEIARSGRKVHEEVLRRFTPPVRVAVLPTPAAFQPNVDAVTGRLVEFVQHSLVNHRPEVTVVRAHRRGHEGDPDDPAVASMLDGVSRRDRQQVPSGL